MFWARYVELCASVNKTPHKVATSLGITSGSVTGWKNGGIPRETTVKKIADYFGVSEDYLKGASDIKNPATDESSEMEKEVVRLFNNVPPENKREALRYLKYLAGRETEDNHG